MSEQITVNDASLPAPLIRWHEMQQYRDFLLLLVWRELYLRYRQTLIGAGWSFLHPLLTMAVFALIVPHLVSAKSLATSTGGVPYPVFVYCGLAAWTCFAHAITRCNTSLVDQHALIKNMYFPRLMLPLSKVLAAFAELLIALAALAILMLILWVPPSPGIVLLPLFFVPLLIAALGAGLILAVLQVKYRDIFFLIQFALQLGMLVTPVWYPLGALPLPTRLLLALNPMTSVVQGFRWCVLGVDQPSMAVLAISTASSAIFLFTGLQMFRARQEMVADHV